MQFVKEIIGGILIIAVSGLIGIAQNTVRDDSLSLVPKTSRAVAKNGQVPQLEVKEEINDPDPSHDGARPAGDAAADWPTEAELAAGELTMVRLRSLIESGVVTVIDARSGSEYETGRITGAINIPYDEFVDYYDQLKTTIPLDAVIVCYCESVACDNSENLAKELGFMGYGNVLVYRGGWQEWEAAGFPVEGISDN